MKILFSLGLLLLGFGLTAGAQQFATRDAHIAFLSETPIEDIRAESHEASAILDVASGRLAFQVPILSFHFPKALMEEHFKKLLESEQYPKASFRGTLSVGSGRTGAQEVTAKGTLEMHGVAVEREVTGTMVRTNRLVHERRSPCPAPTTTSTSPRWSRRHREVIDVTLSATLLPDDPSPSHRLACLGAWAAQPPSPRMT